MSRPAHRTRRSRRLLTSAQRELESEPEQPLPRREFQQKSKGKVWHPHRYYCFYSCLREIDPKEEDQISQSPVLPCPDI